MFKGLTKRNFIKTISLVALRFVVANYGDNTSSNSNDKPADLVTYGKIFNSEDNKIVEAFAVKNGKFVYISNKAGAQAFIKRDKTEVIDYTDKDLVMPSCGNAHAHYLSAYATKKVRETCAKAVFGIDWDIHKLEENILTTSQPIFLTILAMRRLSSETRTAI